MTLEETAAWPSIERLEEVAAFMRRNSLVRLELRSGGECIAMEKEAACTAAAACVRLDGAGLAGPGASAGSGGGPVATAMPGRAGAPVGRSGGFGETAMPGRPDVSAGSGGGFGETALPNQPSASSDASGANGSGKAGSGMTGEAALPAGTVVRTPILGIAYRAKSPEAEPFVQVGSIVAAGDALCLVEAMKMFSEITAPVAGTVLAINFEDGALVEHNAPLFVIG